MQHKLIAPEYAKLAVWLLPQLQPWRRMTIAIDGVDGSGKSSLARFLAWQLDLPAIETDFFLRDGEAKPIHDVSVLELLIDQRHRANRPVIVEGVFVLQQLGAIGIDPELLVRVECSGRDGSYSWQSDFMEYLAKYRRANLPDYRLTWSASE